MYSYIKGIIEEISLDHVVIDNNGIDIKLMHPNTIMKLQLGCECKSIKLLKMTCLQIL